MRSSDFHLALLIGGLRTDIAAARTDLRATRTRLKRLETRVEAIHDRIMQIVVAAALWAMATIGNWKLDEVAGLLLAIIKGGR